MVTHGPKREHLRKVSIVRDWRIADVREVLARHHCPLPPEYEWFGRSFDGSDFRFPYPIRRHVPDDYARILEWFPLADLEIFRRDLAPSRICRSSGGALSRGTARGPGGSHGDSGEARARYAAGVQPGGMVCPSTSRQILIPGWGGVGM
jgi:hypothetical protein